MDAYHIHDLPKEVIRLIFSYLDAYDKLNVSCVSKQWLTLINTPMLLLDVSVTWTDRYESELPSHFTRNFQNFIFVNIELSNKHHNFFKNNGKNIRSMTFDKCSISAELENIFKGQNLCENLNVLKFEDCCLDIFQFLPELKLLQFENVEFYRLNDIQWNEVAPNIKEIYIQLCVPHVDPNVDDENFVEDPSGDADIEMWMQKKTMDVVNSFGNVLVSFSICRNITDYKYLLLKSKNLRLKTLCMYGRSFDLSLLLAQDTITQIRLRMLNRAGNTDQIVSQVCNKSRLLEKLILEDGCSINSCLVNIFQLENLKSLSFFGANIKKEGFINALHEPRLGRLRELILCIDVMIDNETFEKFLIQIPNLRSLELSYCSGFVNNITIQSISKYLKYLRNLKLIGLNKLTDEALFLPESPDKCLQNIKGLRSLQITYCVDITFLGLSKAIEFLELRHLIIDGKHENKLNESEIKLKNQSIRKIEYLIQRKETEIDVTQYAQQFVLRQ